MEWNDLHLVLEGAIPPTKHCNFSGRPLQDATKKSLQYLNHNFRNVSEMEAVIRVAVIVLDAVIDTNLTVQLQPSVKYHTTFTDFYFIIKEHGAEIPKAFIEVKNTSVSVAIGLDIKPVAQALREAQIISEMLPSTINTIPFIITN